MKTFATLLARDITERLQTVEMEGQLRPTRLMYKRMITAQPQFGYSEIIYMDTLGVVKRRTFKKQLKTFEEMESFETITSGDMYDNSNTQTGSDEQPEPQESDDSSDEPEAYTGDETPSEPQPEPEREQRRPSSNRKKKGKR